MPELTGNGVASAKMWPTSHLAIGYLLYFGYTQIRFRRPPAKAPMLFVVIGSLVPDIIDKPLWLAGVVTQGRALGHSLLFVLPLTGLVGGIVYWRRSETEPTVAFGLSSIAATVFDGVQQFIQGSLAVDIEEVSFWVWPMNVPAETIVAFLSRLPAAGYVISNKAAWTAQNLPQQPELGIWIRIVELSITGVALLIWFRTTSRNSIRVLSSVGGE